MASERDKASKLRWVLITAGVVFAGVFAVFATLVVEHARREVIAYHSAPDDARFASIEPSTTSIIIVNFHWRTDDGKYWASWGLHERSVVDGPTRFIQGIPLH